MYQKPGGQGGGTVHCGGHIGADAAHRDNGRSGHRRGEAVCHGVGGEGFRRAPLGHCQEDVNGVGLQPVQLNSRGHVLAYKRSPSFCGAGGVGEAVHHLVRAGNIQYRPAHGLRAADGGDIADLGFCGYVWQPDAGGRVIAGDIILIRSLLNHSFCNLRSQRYRGQCATIHILKLCQREHDVIDRARSVQEHGDHGAGIAVHNADVADLRRLGVGKCHFQGEVLRRADGAQGGGNQPVKGFLVVLVDLRDAIQVIIGPSGYDGDLHIDRAAPGAIVAAEVAFLGQFVHMDRIFPVGHFLQLAIGLSAPDVVEQAAVHIAALLLADAPEDGAALPHPVGVGGTVGS